MSIALEATQAVSVLSLLAFFCSGFLAGFETAEVNAFRLIYGALIVPSAYGIAAVGMPHRSMGSSNRNQAAQPHRLSKPAEAIADYLTQAELKDRPLFRPRTNSRSRKLAATPFDPSTMSGLTKANLKRLSRCTNTGRRHRKHHSLP